MNKEADKKQKSIYKTVIFSLIFLFNPNISVIDILPDFIAYFLLARAFLYAADRAPHFEEARVILTEAEDAPGLSEVYIED